MELLTAPERVVEGRDRGRGACFTGGPAALILYLRAWPILHVKLRYEWGGNSEPRTNQAAPSPPPKASTGAKIMDTEALSAELLLVVNSAEEILRRFSAEESRVPVLAGGWSCRQVIGHLIDSASNNHQRFVRASLQDSLEFPGYDQKGWARVQAAEEADWSLLLALWVNYNRYLAHVIAHLPPPKLEVPCRIGGSEPVTLKFLAEDYLRHMVHHLSQIGAVPAGQ